MLRSVLCSLLLLASAALTARADDQFHPLFNGKNLDGWNGDPELWSVKDGVIVGSSDNKQLPHNSFLATTKSYKNFVVKLKFKLRNHNSGVQFRSMQKPDYVITGYQADIADNAYLGILYEEGGRGILVNVNGEEVAKHLNKDGWNEYVITADGPHITQVLNGFTTVDYTEKDAVGAKEGVIALQMHAGPPMQIEFKDVELKELP